MRRRRSRVALGIAAVVLLLPVVVPMIALRGAQARILAALESGLGRRVQAQAVHLRLVPYPGVELDGVRLGEDPAFGAEDMVVADEATAAVRLLPLFEGRLSFARIDLDGASINLVRNRAGRWNVAALLQAAGQTRGAGARPRPASLFPYLSWSGARINFKLDQIKTRFYLDQVQGSLAHDAGGWWLQARFQPERTDLNLSNTGDVTLDGRWPDAAAGFDQRPFALELRLSNSYLAASSALLAGHDAGLHGILSAQVHVVNAPSGGALQMSGMFQAQSLRRWDLLPPPAAHQPAVTGNFAGLYDPGADRFELTGAGDRGWNRLRLSGSVQRVFSQPSLDLSLRLRRYPAANLVPLALAMKAHLPADLHMEGVLNGDAQLQWTPGVTGVAPRAEGRLSAVGVRLLAGREHLDMPQAELLATPTRGLRFTAAATVAPIGAPVPLTLAATLDPSGFMFRFASPDLVPAAAQALAHLLGLSSPWPPGLTGSADVSLSLGAPWAAMREAGWRGTASFKQARFAPSGADPSLLLTGVTIAWDDPRPARIGFTAHLEGENDVAGQVLWRAGGVVPQFVLEAQHLGGAAVWSWLHPPPTSLLDRMFGPSTPDWIQRLAASGTIRVEDLDWHGIHTAAQANLEGVAGRWRAAPLQLALARGQFAGSVLLAGGEYTIDGTATGPLDAAALLGSTPYAGLLGGQLEGSLQLRRPAGSTSLEDLEASGVFDLRRGLLLTDAGPRAFARFGGSFRLRGGAAELSDLIWIANGAAWAGQGSARLAPGASGDFTLRLHRDARSLVLAGPLVPAARP